MVGASADSVTMVEGEFDEVSEEVMADAIRFGHEAIKLQIAAQVALAEAVGKKETREYEAEDSDDALQQQIHDFAFKNVMTLPKRAVLNKTAVLLLAK